MKHIPWKHLLLPVSALKWLFFVNERRVTRLWAFTAQTVHGSGVYTSPRKRGTVLVKHFRLLNLQTLPSKNVHDYYAGPV